MATLNSLLILVVATLLGSCVLPVPSTVHARGYVRDAVTKRPISGARITLREHPRATAITASDGSFDIPSETRREFVSFVVPLDRSVESTLTVSADEYRPKTAGWSNDNR